MQKSNKSKMTRWIRRIRSQKPARPGAEVSVDSPSARLRGMLSYNLTQMIYVAAKLGIPDLLVKGPKSAAELAAAAGAHARSLYRLLRALSGVGIFAEDRQGRFKLSPAAELLRSDRPDSFRPLLLAYGEPWWWRAWGSLLHSVQTGQTAFDHVHGQSLFEYLGQHPDAAWAFNANMTAMTKSEGGEIATAYDFSKTQLIADVGSGHGTLVSAILKAHPHVRALIFDLPSVVAAARAGLESEGLSHRCELVAGSFFESIPQGADTYALKDILHDWDDDRAIAILQNCRKAMRHGAKLLVIERIVPAGNAPGLGKLLDISMLVMTGGRERTREEYRTLLQSAGFKLKRVFPTRAGTSILEAIPN